MKFPFFLLFFAGMTATGEGNLIFNGSFELGTDGFAMHRNLDSSKNPDLKFFPLKADSSRAGEGKSSLRVENPYGEHFELRSREFPMKPETEYVLRGMIRADRPGIRYRLLVLGINPDRKWLFHTFHLNAEQKWKNFEFKFKTGKNAPRCSHLFLAPEEGKKIPAGTLWLDRLELSEQSQGAGPVLPEIAVFTPVRLYELPEEKEAAFSIKTWNPGKRSVRGTIRLVAREDFSGKAVFSRELAWELGPGERKEYPLRMPLRAYGAYRLEAESGCPAKTLPGFFAVIGKYQPKKLDLENTFYVGLSGGFLLQKSGWRVYNDSFERMPELLAKMGCRVLRGLRTSPDAWGIVEKERGKFDFRDLDILHRTLEKYQFHYLCVLGQSVFVRNPKREDIGCPEWLVPLFRRPASLPSYTWLAVRSWVVLPPKDLWRNYLRKILERGKGKSISYELLNEPNGYMAPDDYMEYARIAMEEIRRADPKSRIVGICATSDFNADASLFIRECIKRGMGEWIDAASFHPYNGRTLGSLNPADAYIQTFRSLVTEGGKKKLPIWNTELFFLFDAPPGTNAYEQELCDPADIVTRFLVDIGENVAQSQLLVDWQLWEPVLLPNFSCAQTKWVELIPSSNYVAHNAVARLFEGARGVRKFRRGREVVCYVYRREGRLIAAVWNPDKKEGIRVDLSAFQVMDLFGNDLKSGEYELGKTPFYLTQGTLSEKEFLAKLENFPVRILQPFSVSERVRKIGDRVFATIRNDSDKAADAVCCFRNAEWITPSPVRCEIPAQKSVSLELPLQRRSGTSGSGPEIWIAFGDQEFRFPVAVEESSWLPSSFRLPNAEGSLRLEADRIVLSMRVSDTSRAGESGRRKPWETDSVELFFDRDPLTLPRTGIGSCSSSLFRLFLLPWDSRKLQASGSIRAEECRLRFQPEAGGYSFTLEIPGKNREMLGFDLKVNDRNGRSLRTVQLGKGRKIHINRCQYGILRKGKNRPEKKRKNLFRNGNFEQPNTLEWQIIPASAKERVSLISSSSPFCGEKSLLLRPNPGESMNIQSVDLPIQPGKTVELRFRGCASPKTDLEVFFDFWRNSRTPHLWRRQRFRITPEWREQVFRYTVPGDLEKYPALKEGKMKVRFHLPRTSPASAVYLDNLEFRNDVSGE